MNRTFALVVLIVCASGAGAAPTYRDSTRLHQHINDNGQAQHATQKRLHVGDPGTYGHKNPAQMLMPKVRGDTQREAGASTTLVQSITTVGVEGWTTVKADNNPSSVQLGADIGKGVVGSDTGGETWYFMAPGDKFAGDMAQAYNGRLTLTLVHAETPSGGSVRREPDVILEASCGHSLMLYNFASKVGASVPGWLPQQILYKKLHISCGMLTCTHECGVTLAPATSHSPLSFQLLSSSLSRAKNRASLLPLTPSICRVGIFP